MNIGNLNIISEKVVKMQEDIRKIDREIKYFTDMLDRYSNEVSVSKYIREKIEILQNDKKNKSVKLNEYCEKASTIAFKSVSDYDYKPVDEDNIKRYEYSEIVKHYIERYKELDRNDRTNVYKLFSIDKNNTAYEIVEDSNFIKIVEAFENSRFNNYSLVYGEEEKEEYFAVKDLVYRMNKAYFKNEFTKKQYDNYLENLDIVEILPDELMRVVVGTTTRLDSSNAKDMSLFELFNINDNLTNEEIKNSDNYKLLKKIFKENNRDLVDESYKAKFVELIKLFNLLNDKVLCSEEIRKQYDEYIKKSNEKLSENSKDVYNDKVDEVIYRDKEDENSRYNRMKSKLKNRIKLSKIVYDAKFRKYKFYIQYEKDGILKTVVKPYNLSIMLVDDNDKTKLQRRYIYNRYGKEASKKVDLNLLRALGRFDDEFGFNYKEEYLSGDLSVDLEYNFRNEIKFSHRSFVNNLKLNHKIHSIAKNQKSFSDANYYVSKKVLGSVVVAATLLFSLIPGLKKFNSVVVKDNKNKVKAEKVNNDYSEVKKKDKAVVTRKEKTNSGKKIVEANINTNNVTESRTKSVTKKSNEGSFSGSLMSINDEKKSKIDDLEDLEKFGYVYSSDVNGFGLGDKVVLDGMKISNLASDKLGSIDYISEDMIDADSYKISRMVVMEDGKVLDEINLSTEDKYSVKSNEIYKVYGPNVDIAFNFYGYKGDVVYKDIGWVNIDSISNLSDKTKEKISKSDRDSNEQVLVKRKAAN